MDVEVIAVILERANDYFGPTDRDTRIEMLLVLSEDKQQQIHKLTDEFNDAEDQGISLADLFEGRITAIVGAAVASRFGSQLQL